MAQQVAGQVVADMNNVTSGALSAVGINSKEELGQYLGSWLGWLLNSLVPTAAAAGGGTGAGAAAGAGGGQQEVYGQMQGQEMGQGGQQQQDGAGGGGVVVVVQHQGAEVEAQQQTARVLQSQDGQKQQQQQPQQQPGAMESDLVPFAEVGVATAGDGSGHEPGVNSTFAAAGANNDTAPAFRSSNTAGDGAGTDQQYPQGPQHQASSQVTHGSASTTAQQPLPLPLQLLQQPLPPLAGRDINVNINVNVVPQTVGLQVPGTSGYAGVVGGGGPTCTCRCPLVAPGGVGGFGVGSALPLLRSSAPQGFAAGTQAPAGVGSGPAGGVPGQWAEVPGGGGLAAGNGYTSMQQSEGTGTETSPGVGGRLKDVLPLRPLKQWLEQRQQQQEAAADAGALAEGGEGQQQQQGEPAGGGRRLQQNSQSSGSYRPGTRRHSHPGLTHDSIPTRWRHADPGAGAGTALMSNRKAGAPNDAGAPLSLQPDLRGITPRRQLQQQNTGSSKAKGEQGDAESGKATAKQQGGKEPPVASQSPPPPKATRASPEPAAARTSAPEPGPAVSNAGGGKAVADNAGSDSGKGQGNAGSADGAAVPVAGVGVGGDGQAQQEGGIGMTVSVDQLLQAVLQQLAAGGLQMKLGVGSGGPSGGAAGSGAAVGPSATAVATAGVTGGPALDMKGADGGGMPHGPNVNVNPIVVPGVLDQQRGVAGWGGSACPPCIC